MFSFSLLLSGSQHNNIKMTECYRCGFKTNKLIELKSIEVKLCPPCFYEVGWYLHLIKYRKVNIARIIEYFRKKKFITARDLEDYLIVSKATAYELIRSFENAGVLRKNGDKWEYVWK